MRIFHMRRLEVAEVQAPVRVIYPSGKSVRAHLMGMCDSVELEAVPLWDKLLAWLYGCEAKGEAVLSELEDIAAGSPFCLDAPTHPKGSYPSLYFRHRGTGQPCMGIIVAPPQVEG